MTSEFVHLHNHSDYSLLDGAQRIDQLVNTIDDLNMDSVALTEHGNMFSVVPYYNRAKKAGIKPIIGCEIYVATGSRFEKKTTVEGGWGNNHLILLAQNYTGYKNLMKLVTAGYLEGFYYRPRVDVELLRQFSEGLICMSACLKGEVPEKMLKGDYEGAKAAALRFAEIFPDRYYLEIQNHGIPEEEANIKNMKKLAADLNLPLVCTNDAHYAKQSHWEAHDIHICLGTGNVRSDEKRLRYATPEFYFKTQDEMFNLFKEFPQAIENTRRIADSINVELKMGEYHLPNFPIPEGSPTKDPDEYLKILTQAGAGLLYGEITPSIQKRIDHELLVIKNMGFAGYFLITADFVQYSKDQMIPVGPGRGSAAGSIVSYALGITSIDPLKHDLLFERFLNPNRVSMPDIDIDFCIERRGEVIDYIKDQYGENSVTQIITFGKMRAKQVVRDVGRVMGYSFGEVNKIAKAIPNELNITLDKALEKSPDLQQMAEGDYKELMTHSKVLEGMNRHASIHAAGVVIVPGDLTDYIPLYKSSTDDITSQYDMKGLEELGLLKMDFLGLRTLTVIDKAVKLIAQKGKIVNIEKISFEDEKVYELFAKGLTIGVFQFESSGMREFLKKLKPTVIEDLIAMNALYRPGPMENIDDFISRKHGEKKIVYSHALLESILKETYGIIVYQEQVMQIAHEVADFTLAEADIMRRAMGKKQDKVMDELSVKFVEGSGKKGISKKKAEEIFLLIKKFAKYGFNKSHSAAYAYIAYQTAWLKTYYPAEFMSANLSSEIGKMDRVVILINECKKLELDVTPPDINVSYQEFRPVNETKISYGLNAIKNVGTKALETIIDERSKNGKYESIFDLCARIDQQKVNKRVIESMIMSGTMDSLDGNRAQQFSAIDEAIRYGQQMQSEKDRNQFDLFGGGNQDDILIKTPILQQMADWSEKDSLAKEKEVLGSYISGHPLLEHAEDLEEFTSITFGEEQEFSKNDTIVVGGMITRIVNRFDRRNREMAFFDMDCLGGQAEVIAFSDCFKSYGNLIEEGNVVFVRGKPSDGTDFSDLKIMGDEIIPVDRVRNRLSQKLNIKFPSGEIKPEDIDELMNISKRYPGECKLIFHLPNNGSPRPMKVMAHNIKISTEREYIRTLRTKYGKDNVWVE
ncbi:MAG: DNA polymerase III subunit alpha [Candidatus Marinimicrobia bacterium]|jgi:DNA polymerase-3 subunit alpha|nr:DNA polymerase III subunit alpha [Candidatus Neomarinimicrobiota bacterium]MBT3838421.1 DNA polymerase III subunit alpha [Candidatus Neomarinimicrobiota bacterium]MBT3998726.1 DNA polymerase III subunit alpha [Candidatus Neomarinimicrobiota bacterium]MBT4578382.1 DNA polymerase III subunit alpha [Candidatus Neomarinimicrobiota bacterium]MBT4958152.1 DNA polymerase III subunit alpha [Candidatus Neomarinimicrobiota bacterium]